MVRETGEVCVVCCGEVEIGVVGNVCVVVTGEKVVVVVVVRWKLVCDVCCGRNLCGIRVCL